MKSENRPTEFVLIGQPRTGTTYVMMLLNSHGDIFCENELFNPFGIVRAKAKQSKCNFLDVPYRQMISRLKKQGNDIIAERISNFDKPFVTDF